LSLNLSGKQPLFEIEDLSAEIPLSASTASDDYHLVIETHGYGVKSKSFGGFPLYASARPDLTLNILLYGQKP
jgi:hypothetical protein